MKVRKVVIYVAAVSVLIGFIWGCGGKEDGAEEETEGGSPPSTDVSEVIEPGEISKGEKKGDAEGLQMKADEVRSTFMSLQKVCEANDIEGYLDFWDYESKKFDGRDMSIEERRELQRKSLTKVPGILQEIANLQIESISVETSQAEKIKNVFGAEIEGTMMVVRTNGRSLLFHETDKGWKLFTIASRGYFR